MKPRTNLPITLMITTGAILFSLSVAFAQCFTFSTFDAPLAATGTTAAQGISGGKIVGFYTDGAGYTHGFIKSGTNYLTLDDPAASLGTYPNGGTRACGISGNTVVGNFRYNGSFAHGFIYDIPSGTWQNEDDPIGEWGTFFTGVSGNLVVGANSHPPIPFGDDGIIYNMATSTYSYLNDPNGAGGESTIATGISSNTVVGYYNDGGGVRHGFSYDLLTSTFTPIDDPQAGTGPVMGTFVDSVSGNSIVGYFIDSSNHTHGFLKSGGVYLTLDVPGAINTYASGTDGNTIVGYFEDGTGDHGFVATPNLGVSIALYAGVTIKGIVGYTYGIQTMTNLLNTNSWIGVTNLTLSAPAQIWYDSHPGNLPQQYYRVLPGPISIP